MGDVPAPERSTAGKSAGPTKRQLQERVDAALTLIGDDVCSDSTLGAVRVVLTGTAS